MKLRLTSLAHVHGVGVSVHNHGRFVRVTEDVKHDFHYVGQDCKNHRERLPQGVLQFTCRWYNKRLWRLLFNWRYI